ncbi:hypothetical protein IEQ34_006480 [Dendrobium chrysotoxum]|uniref:Uncharacterized protein n=1 Tax=Dendrobium chrysotoxum TaxID=161865 RepID=A0AAV7HBX3_DENCH|nr:hypothetical protein IEQ34_006480 [Dendrobium chrysotoxum]
MAMLSSKTSVLLLMVAFSMISSLPRDAESAKIPIIWPGWYWCFPYCVIGETCFSRMTKYCSYEMPYVSLVNCMVVALEWCDLNQFSINQLVPSPPPPTAKSYNGTNKTALNQKATLE